MNTDSVSGLLLEEQKLGAISGTNEPPAAPGVEEKFHKHRIENVKIEPKFRSKS